MQRRHQQRRCCSLARHVTESDDEAAVISFNEVVVVTTDFVTRETDSLQFIPGNDRRCCWLKALLNLAGECEFAFEALALQSFFDESRVLNSDRRYRCQRSQNLQMIFSKSAF